MTASKRTSLILWLPGISGVLLFAALQAVYWPRYQVAGSDLVLANSSRYPVRVQIPATVPTEWTTPAKQNRAAKAVENTLVPSGPLEESNSVAAVPVDARKTATPGIEVLLPVEYNLSRAGDTKGALEVTKPLTINGQKVAPLSVKIVGGATILVSRSELLGLLQAEDVDLKGARLLPNVEHVSFRQLRDAGLEVRYDPVADAITLKAES